MEGEVVGADILADGGGELGGEVGEMDIGQSAAGVTEQVIVLFGDAVEAVGAAVGVDAADHAGVTHGVEVIVDRCHGDGGHLELGEEKDLVGGQVMAVGLVQDLQDQGALLGHIGSPHGLESI